MSKEITAGNKLIAEGNKTIMLFDEWKKATRQTFDPDHNGGSNTIHGFEKYGSFVREEDVEFDIVYHQSWDALMPVVEKIETLGYSVNILRTGCSVYDEKFKNTGEGFRKSVNGLKKIEAVFFIVIQFITWYNQQNT